MAISSDFIQKSLPLLRPLMFAESERRAYLIQALGTEASVLNNMRWSIPTDAFITEMLLNLDSFGEITPGTSALCALLKVVREGVGVDIQLLFDELIASTQQNSPASQTPAHLLFDLLLQMDFKQQVRLVKTVIELHHTAAFLVHGEPYCGQQLLVTRLLRLQPKWKKISPIKIDVSHNGVGRSISHLWRQLTSWLGLDKDAEPNEIIEKVCDRLLTQDVIFIFYTVDYMPPKVLSGWLQAFWEPLVTSVPNQKDKHLLMFLVDNSGSVCESNILLAQQFSEPDYPRIPLNLPPVIPFPSDILDDWIDNIQVLSDVQIPAGLTSQTLLEKSENGIPQLVYEEICSHCGHSWEGGLAKWLI
jgi:inactive STAND/Effector-associated domain 8